MEVKSFTPRNRLLQNYIECFYTLTRDAGDDDDVYIAFPNILSILCLHKQTKIELIENVRTLSHCPDNEIESNLICHINGSEQIRYRGEADEICIYFKPLGINAFLDKELRQYVQSAVAEFNPFEDYHSRIAEIFSFRNVEDRIHALENYWLSKHIGFQHPFMHQIVGEMMENESSFSLSETARKIGISRTTLVKHFDSHLCTTPSHFKKVARFRSAMKQHRHKFAGEKLTDISCSADYFDQSHMIKDFKSLTKFSPKPFFSKISQLENGRINWIFL
jgi:AraC-like DNA-binding protein